MSNATLGFLDGLEGWRVVVTSLSAFSGGWGLYVGATGACTALSAKLAPLGRAPGLWAYEHELPLGAARARAFLERCIEHDVLAAAVSRPARPDEPLVTISMWSSRGAHASVARPAGEAVASIDAVVRAATKLHRQARRSALTREAPLEASWRPWLRGSGAGP